MFRSAATQTTQAFRSGLQPRPRAFAARLGVMAAGFAVFAVLAGAVSERADAAYWQGPTYGGPGIVQSQGAGLGASCTTQYWANNTKTWTIRFWTTLYGTGFAGAGNVEAKYGAQAGSSWYGLYGPYTVFNYSNLPYLTWTVPASRPGVSVRAVANFALWINGVRVERPQEQAEVYGEYLNGINKFYGGGHQGCWLY